MKALALDPDLAAWLAEDERERAERIAYQARCLKLAEHNGFPIEMSTRDDLPGHWWVVPAELYTIVGCMMARIA